MERIYLGVDLHASQMTIHRITKEPAGGSRREREMVRAERYDEFFARLPAGSHVCVEASTGAFEFVRRAQGRAGSVHVVNPQAMKELYCTGKKTDRIDARKLADRIARHLEDRDPNDGFPEVWIPDELTQELRKLASHYDFVRRELASTRNRLAMVFRQRMIRIADSSADCVRAALDHPGLSRDDRFSLELGLQRLSLYEQQRSALRARIEELGVRAYPRQIRLLVSVPGISVFIAAVFLAEVGDVRRFASAKKLAAYLCAAPTIDSSGQSSRVGGLSKRGRKRAYRLILQALNHVIAGNHAFSAFAERKRRGKNACKVRAAIARKTIVSLFYILRNQEVCRFANIPLYERKLREIEALGASLAA
jgi:transposase